MAEASKTTAKKKAAPKKVTDADVVKYLTKLQKSGITRDERTSVTAVIRLLS